MHIHNITNVNTHQSKRPCLRGHKIYIFGNISSVCLIYASGQRRIFLKKQHFHYITYIAPLQHKNPCFRGREFIILVQHKNLTLKHKSASVSAYSVFKLRRIKISIRIASIIVSIASKNSLISIHGHSWTCLFSIQSTA